ncbi:MAG: DoxX family protein [Saprospiraceae bacterium]
MSHILDLIGRMLMSAIFFFEAVDSIMNAPHTKMTMAQYHIVWQQDLLLYVTISFLIIGALMLLTGYRVKLGVWLLLIYWLPVTFIVYSFWNDPVSVQRINAIYFMRNMAIAGGLLVIASHGAGRYSIRRLLTLSKIPASET